MFSSRVPHGVPRNQLSLALERRRREGLPIVDLTLSNPTVADFVYGDHMLAALSDPRGLRYEPEPFGLESARRAVANEVGRLGTFVASHQIVLTASTSEAYSLLFKLLCDPGDAVLVPRPSYPLVEHLTRLDGVALDHYSLEFHGRWTVDFEALSEKLTSDAGGRIRAIVVVTPNNPTGSVLDDDELQRLGTLARAHDVAIIADEVFADYVIADTRPASVLRQSTALTFALGGLSKSIGMPQVKLGWMAVTGPPPDIALALERLETMCDTYLSVSTAVQLAAPSLLKEGAAVRAQIQQRIRDNYACLERTVREHPSCTLLPAAAGWYAVVQVPATRSEEAIVVDLLERHGIAVHPGYFFDFEREAFLVVSLLPRPQVFADGVRTLCAEVGASR
jgi:aspartate/methionine/tyrosine aminotransferase